MIKGTKASVAMIAMWLLAVGCKGADADKAIDNKRSFTETPLMYLQREVPPCTPVSGSRKNPCAVIGKANLPTNALTKIYSEIPAYWDLYYHPDRLGTVFTPHIVMRASFLPNTTRCDFYDRQFPAFAGGSGIGYLLMCVIDVRVNAYLLGTGPSQITVAAHTYPFLYGEGSDLEWIEWDRVEIANAYQGREGVLFLSPSSTTVVEAWEMMEVWDVQQTENEITVVAPYKEEIERIAQSEFTPEEVRSKFTPDKLGLLEVPLLEFTAIISRGAVARATETGGRIGVGDDSPMLITDANLLRPYYEGPGVGVSYETDAPVSPPPVPGGDDPAQPPITTGEEGGGSGGTRPSPGQDDQPDDSEGGTVP